MPELLIYGANGYTGQLLAERAIEAGLRPILAGRNGEEVQALATRLGLQARVFSLDPASLRENLPGIAVVLHAAGPFSATARPMVDACLAAGAHYVDVTGEIAVLEAVAARDPEARAANVMLLPGAGFDVVPTDCMAAHVKRRLPGAVRLRLGVAGVGGGVSRGTARTMLEGIGRGTLVRRGGRIVALSRTPRAEIDFGRGPRAALGLSWGDVATAWRSTGIPDIEVFFALTPSLARVATLPHPVKRLLGSPLLRPLLGRGIRRRPPGPTPEQRARGRSIIVAEAWDAPGRSVRSRLETVEAYTLTAWTAVEIARRALMGEAVPGAHTPATAYGPDFVLSFDATVRQDL
ncbi:MAG TPA: saccharopine dehydrogenase NADP-binding domain-containing protein [Candidatus Polarisedimenticolaceae bacterium]|nr:saccharopine dehydrogenase NADP-binding domain-containing protein [Candidatus Polarisedimenticolaceae bacterium]